MKICLMIVQLDLMTREGRVREKERKEGGLGIVQ
jgi:hypothetical protein